MSNVQQYQRDKALVRNRRAETIEQAIMDGASEQLEARCKELGIGLVHDVAGSHGVRSSQWGFYRETWRVANYWPATGLLQIGGVNYAAGCVTDALEKVYQVIGPPRPGPRNHGPRPKGKSKRNHQPRPEGAADRPYPAQRRRKPKKHESRNGDAHTGDVKTLRKMIEGAIRRHSKRHGNLAADEFRAILTEVSENPPRSDRKADAHTADAKVLFGMLRGAVRRCQMERPAITSRDIQTALADLAETFVKT